MASIKIGTLVGALLATAGNAFFTLLVKSTLDNSSLRVSAFLLSARQSGVMLFLILYSVGALLSFGTLMASKRGKAIVTHVMAMLAVVLNVFPYFNGTRFAQAGRGMLLTAFVIVVLFFVMALVNRENNKPGTLGASLILGLGIPALFIYGAMLSLPGTPTSWGMSVESYANRAIMFQMFFNWAVVAYCLLGVFSERQAGTTKKAQFEVGDGEEALVDDSGIGFGTESAGESFFGGESAAAAKPAKPAKAKKQKPAKPAKAAKQAPPSSDTWDF
jgi:hypothetical protein